MLAEVAQAYRIPLEDGADAADALIATHKEQISLRHHGPFAREYPTAYTARRSGFALGGGRGSGTGGLGGAREVAGGRYGH